MNKIFKTSAMLIPAAFAVIMMSCNGGESKTEATDTAAMAPAVESVPAGDTLPPLDTTAATKPEDKLNGPAKKQ